MVVVGAGLIGTSTALSLRAHGVDVAISDRDEAHVRLACDLGAGRPVRQGERFDVAVIAVPPSAVVPALIEAQRINLASTYTDVASVKVQPLAEAETRGVDLTTFVGGHPLAGREQSGPAAARQDLFVGRPWVLVPHERAAPSSVELVLELVRLCGAVAVTMSASEHDAAVAVVSHLPHVISALLAAQLRDIPAEQIGISGSGLRDTTRLAAGDTGLWTQILVANAAPTAEALARFQQDVAAMVKALESVRSGEDTAGTELRALLDSGVEGRDRIPGKHGGPTRTFTTVSVVIPDAPGELARLLTAAGAAGINVEDVRLDHEPGRPFGLAELAVTPDSTDALVGLLRGQGWSVHS